MLAASCAIHANRVFKECRSIFSNPRLRSVKRAQVASQF